jgi:hypothetical protein
MAAAVDGGFCAETLQDISGIETQVPPGAARAAVAGRSRVPGMIRPLTGDGGSYCFGPYPAMRRSNS